MNKEKLRSVIALQGDNWSALAKKLGVTPQAINKKLNKGFNFKDIKKIKELYNLTDEQVFEIF